MGYFEKVFVLPGREGVVELVDGGGDGMVVDGVGDGIEGDCAVEELHED